MAISKSYIRTKKRRKTHKTRLTVYTVTPGYETRKRLEEEKDKKKKEKKNNKAVTEKILTKNKCNKREISNIDSNIDIFLNESFQDKEFLKNLVMILDHNISVGSLVLVRFTVIKKTDIYYAGRFLVLPENTEDDYEL